MTERLELANGYILEGNKVTAPDGTVLNLKQYVEMMEKLNETAPEEEE